MGGESANILPKKRENVKTWKPWKSWKTRPVKTWKRENAHLASKKRFGREKNKMSTCGVWTHFWYPNGPLGERWLLKVSSASDSKRPKHQQDSSPCQAKTTQTKCFTSPLEPIRKNKASVPKHPNASSSRASAKQKTVWNVDSERWPLKVSSASDSKRPKHQQDSSPCQAKNTQTECFTSPLEPIKNKASVPKQPNASMSRAHAKQKTRRKNASCRWLLEPIKNNALVRLHNTRTPARFEPIKNNALVRFHNTHKAVRPSQPAQNNKLRYKNTSLTKHRIRGSNELKSSASKPLTFATSAEQQT